MKNASLPFLNPLINKTKQNEKTITPVRHEPETHFTDAVIFDG